MNPLQNPLLAGAIEYLARGNPEAVAFLVTLFKTTPDVFDPVSTTLQQCHIVGINLKVLWNDLCNKNMDKVFSLCTLCPNDILIDACSRQDSSGRELVAPYSTVMNKLTGYLWFIAAVLLFIIMLTLLGLYIIGTILYQLVMFPITYLQFKYQIWKLERMMLLAQKRIKAQIEAYLCDGEYKYDGPMVRKYINAATENNLINAQRAIDEGEPQRVVLRHLIGNIKRFIK